MKVRADDQASVCTPVRVFDCGGDVAPAAAAVRAEARGGAAAIVDRWAAGEAVEPAASDRGGDGAAGAEGDDRGAPAAVVVGSARAVAGGELDGVAAGCGEGGGDGGGTVEVNENVIEGPPTWKGRRFLFVHPFQRQTLVASNQCHLRAAVRG